jgi:hypothetical protein
MLKIEIDGFGSHAKFHFEYLKALFVEKNISYSKSFPGPVLERYYLEQLQKRIEETSHLNSLKYFFEFCNTVQQQITGYTE